MSDSNNRRRSSLSRQCCKRFIEFLPQIRQVVTYAARSIPRHAREEFIADCLANAFCAFVNLVKQGRGSLAYPTVLARYAVRAVRSDRKIGSRQCGSDVMSRICQRRKGVSLISLHRPVGPGEWEELVVEDSRATPADVAACRLDFRAWLGRLSALKRAVAKYLASGAGTFDAAKRFGLTPGRISQIRRELKRSCEDFLGTHGDLAAA